MSDAKSVYVDMVYSKEWGLSARFNGEVFVSRNALVETIREKLAAYADLGPYSDGMQLTLQVLDELKEAK